MTRSSISVAVLVFVLATPLLPTAVRATESKPPTEKTVPAEKATQPPEVFSETVAVRVINVDVFATDKKGRPISGLTPEDFELYEDGRRVEISHFFAATEGSVSSSSAIPATTGQSSASAEAPQPRVAPRKIPNIVAYIDNMNLRKGGRKRVLDDLGLFLANSADQGSRVMIVIHGREGLRPLLAPTADKAKIAETLASVRSMTAEGFRQDLDRRAVLREIRDIFTKYSALPNRVSAGPCEMGESEFNFAVEGYARNTMANNEVAANAMSILIGALAGWPGLKSVIYVSDGLPQFAGTDLFSYLADLCPQSASTFLANFNRFDTSRIFDHITQQANANQVTIHTLEARGLTNYSGSSVDSEGSFGGRIFTPSPGNDSIRRANYQSTLFRLAEDTGGRSVLNANDFALDLEKIGADTRSYYSLGFTTRQRGDGRVHRLRVEVVNPKIRIRHRKSYRDKPIEETLVERTLGALVFDLEDNPLNARIEIAQVPLKEGASEVRLSIRIPQDKLALLPTTDHRQGRLRLVLTARDSDNKMLPMKQKQVPVIAPLSDTGTGTGTSEAHLEIGIDLPPGSHELVLAIRDEITASTSYLRRTVQVEERSPTVPGEDR